MFRDKVEKEIRYREDFHNIEASVKRLSLNDNDKHVQKLCEIEKIPEKERYKPSATLNKVQEVQPNSKIFKIMEDCVQCNKPTKLILLPESIDILKKQDERVKVSTEAQKHHKSCFLYRKCFLLFLSSYNLRLRDRSSNYSCRGNKNFYGCSTSLWVNVLLLRFKCFLIYFRRNK